MKTIYFLKDKKLILKNYGLNQFGTYKFENMLILILIHLLMRNMNNKLRENLFSKLYGVSKQTSNL